MVTCSQLAWWVMDMGHILQGEGEVVGEFLLLSSSPSSVGVCCWVSRVRVAAAATGEIGDSRSGKGNKVSLTDRQEWTYRLVTSSSSAPGPALYLGLGMLLDVDLVAVDAGLRMGR